MSVKKTYLLCGQETYLSAPNVLAVSQDHQRAESPGSDGLLMSHWFHILLGPTNANPRRLLRMESVVAHVVVVVVVVVLRMSTGIFVRMFPIIHV